MVCTSYYKNNDQWQEICDLHIKREGKWQKICAGWRKTNGEWQQFYLSNKPSVEFLVVAGGGGGGANNVGYDPSGGGGGAGGFRVSNGVAEVSGRNSEPETALSLEVGVTYTVEVGGGGNGSNGDNSHGRTGNNSVLGIITSLGGGGAGYYGSSSYEGGSGGGRPGDGTRGCGTANQGHDGNVGGGNQGAGGGGAGGSSLGCTGTFNRSYTTNSTITIPVGVTSVTYTIHGAEGAWGSPSNTRVNTSGGRGGKGQKISGVLTNVAGETLTLIMGAVGSTSFFGNQGGAGGSGYVNGGAGGNDGSEIEDDGAGAYDAGPGGGGGGATAIVLGSTLLALAGGGGGGGSDCFSEIRDPDGKTSTTINSTGTASNGGVGGTSGGSFNGGGGGGGGGFPGGDGGVASISGNDISGEGGYGGDGYYNPSYHSSPSTLETFDAAQGYITIEYQVGSTGPDISSSDGGDGLPSNITGISTYYAGGGGTYSGDGGIGGGGDGGYNNYCGTSKAWSHGTTNTGGGGGGTGNICAPARPGNSQLGDGLRQAGNGGSGIVIFRVPQFYQARFSAGMTVNGQSSGSSFVPTPNTAVSGYNIYSVTGGIGSFTLEFA